MKKLSLARFALWAMGIALTLGGSSELNAASSASATANANSTVVANIAISKTADLEFGQVVSNPGAYTVTMSPAGTATSSGSPSDLPAAGPTRTAAAFTVTGANGATYAITLPSSISLSDGSGHTMTVDTFTSNPSSTGTLTGGTQTLNVGAKLSVGASQTAGSYTNTFTVSVIYN